jgi:hypothetical protein
MVRVGRNHRRSGRNSQQNVSQVTHALSRSCVIDNDFHREFPSDEVQSPAKTKNRGQFGETR